jgi:hypothetical protein
MGFQAGAGGADGGEEELEVATSELGSAYAQLRKARPEATSAMGEPSGAMENVWASCADRENGMEKPSGELGRLPRRRLADAPS